jgi:hypothetical protein
MWSCGGYYFVSLEVLITNARKLNWKEIIFEEFSVSRVFFI